MTKAAIAPVAPKANSTKDNLVVMSGGDTLPVQAKYHTQEKYSKTLQGALTSISQRIDMHLPDNKSPMSAWDIAMRMVEKGPVLSPVEFYVFFQRVSTALSTRHKKGMVYRTTRRILKPNLDFLGIGPSAKQNLTYGYGRVLSSTITPGPNADDNEAKRRKAMAVALDKTVENSKLSEEEVVDRASELVAGLSYPKLVLIRDVLNMAMDDAVKISQIEAANGRGEKEKEIRARLDEMSKQIAALQQDM